MGNPFYILWKLKIFEYSIWNKCGIFFSNNIAIWNQNQPYSQVAYLLTEFISSKNEKLKLINDIVIF